MTSKSTKRELQLLRFFSGDDCYCLETTQVASVRRWEETVPETGADGIVASLRTGSRTYPVYSLARRLGFEVGPSPSGPVLLVRSASHVYGIQVDRVARTVQVPVGDAKRLPASLTDPQGRIRGTVRVEEQLAVCLAASRLVPPPVGVAIAPEEPLSPPETWNGNPPSMADQRLLCLSEPSGDKNMLFGFTIRQAIEIASGLPFTRFAAANSFTIGIADWRGHIVPVVNPGALLGIAAKNPDLSQARMAILRGCRSNHLFAIPATGFATLSPATDSRLASAKPMASLGPYIRAAFDASGEYLVLPDLDRIAEMAARH